MSLAWMFTGGAHGRLRTVFFQFVCGSCASRRDAGLEVAGLSMLGFLNIIRGVKELCSWISPLLEKSCTPLKYADSVSRLSMNFRGRSCIDQISVDSISGCLFSSILHLTLAPFTGVVHLSAPLSGPLGVWPLEPTCAR